MQKHKGKEALQERGEHEGLITVMFSIAELHNALKKVIQLQHQI